MSGMLPVEGGIPIPPPSCKQGGRPAGVNYVYPWRKMRPGDSFFVPADRSWVNRIQSRLSTLGRHRGDVIGASFTTRIVEGGVRVWRVD